MKLLLSIYLFLSIINPYSIEIPNNIDIDEEGTIEIKVNGLKENETITISTDDLFTLSDEYGKQDINGLFLNNSLIFKQDDTKSFNYEINDLSAGKWSGKINLSINYEKIIPTNTLISGTDLNAILKALAPNYITFSHEDLGENYYEDISTKQDQSVLLYYVDDENIVISNRTNVPIYANEDMSMAFDNVKSLIGIYNLDYLDMSKTYNIENLFNNCIYLTDLNGYQNWNLENVTSFKNLFASCKSLKEIDLSNIDTSKITSLENTFYCCNSLDTITGIEALDLSSVETIKRIFYSDTSLTSLNISNWNVSNVKDMSEAFANAENLLSLDLSSWDVSSVNNFYRMFLYCTNLKSLGSLDNWNVEETRTFSGFLQMCENLTDIGNLDNWNLENCQSLERMFYGAKSLVSIGSLSNWNVYNVENFKETFRETRNLTNLDIENWNVSNNATTLEGMFRNHRNLKKNLDLKKWDVSNVKTFAHLFRNNFSVKNLDISTWDVSNATSFESMFEVDVTDTPRLENIIGLNNLNTASLTTIKRMFYRQSALDPNNVDLSSWDKTNLSVITDAFKYSSLSEDTLSLN